MIKVEEIQQYGTSVQSGVQAIATAYGDYTRKSFEDTRSFVDRLSGVKSIDKALEVQTEYAKIRLRDLCDRSRRRSWAYTPISPGKPSSRWKTSPQGNPAAANRALDATTKIPKQKPGRCGRAFSYRVRFIGSYRATRSALSAVPIVLKVVAIWLELVSMKNLLRSLAQFCSTVEVGSAGVLVFTWIV